VGSRKARGEAGETLQAREARILKVYHVLHVGNEARINTNGSHSDTQEEEDTNLKPMHKHSSLSWSCCVSDGFNLWEII